MAKAEADLWLLNSCTVKGPAEDHFRNAVAAAKESGKAVVVAGCVPQGDPNVAYLKVSLSFIAFCFVFGNCVTYCLFLFRMLALSVFSRSTELLKW